MARHIVVSLAEGRLVRDLLTNGFLDFVLQEGYKITVVTPADRVPCFVRQWQRPSLQFAHLHRYDDSRPLLSRSMRLRKRLARLRSGFVLNKWLALERSFLFSKKSEYEELFRTLSPSLVVATNATATHEAEIMSTARSMRIPTLAVVGSWDRLYKHMHTRAEHISVWNDINRQEAIELEGYDPAFVHVTGPAQLDAYFCDSTTWTREEFCRRLGLNPLRSIILLATLGSFVNGFDETYLLDWLLAQIESGAIAGDPQIICRLHPFSRLEYFLPYGRRPNVYLSYMQGYVPTLGYTMSRNEIIEVGNILRHSDVVITPGSTMTIEAAIFDTPTVVPVFHSYQPELADNYYRTRVLGRHFARIQKLNLVPIVHEEQECLKVINRCLREPGWYRTQREQLVRDYVQFVDGRSTERLAQLAIKLARNGISE